MGEEIEVKEKIDVKTKIPKKYKVFLLNDDYSTFDFVIRVITKIFEKSETEAEKITMEIHNRGKGLVGIYPKDIADTKIYEVEQMAMEVCAPLTAVAEQE